MLFYLYRIVTPIMYADTGGRAPLRIPVADTAGETVKTRFRGESIALIRSCNSMLLSCILIVIFISSYIHCCSFIHSDTFYMIVTI